MLKKGSSVVLVHPLHEAMQWVPVKASTSWVPVAPETQRATASRSLRPCWKSFLNILEDLLESSGPMYQRNFEERQAGF